MEAVAVALILVITSPSGHTTIVMPTQEKCEDAAKKLERMSADATHTCPAHGGGCWSANGTSPVSATCIAGEYRPQP